MSRTAFALVFFTLAGCGSSSETSTPGAAPPAETPFQETYPDVPASAPTTTLHVSARYSGAMKDGTAEHPFATISEAVGAASGPTTLLVATGTYKENVVVDKPGIAIVGPSLDAGGIILQAPAPYAISVKGAGDIILQNVAIDAPQGAGIWFSNATGVVTSCKVDGAKAVNGAQGFGIVATDGGQLTVQTSTVTNSESAGILVDGAGAIILQNQIAGSGRGGVRLQGTAGMSRIENNQITGNQELGLAIFGAGAIILQNQVTGTVAPSDGPAKGLADGIVVAEGPAGASTVEIRQSNVVDGNGRAGILFSGNVGGIILQNQITNNGHAGVLLQNGAGGDAGITVQGNTLATNHVAGIGVTASARGIILQNQIGGTIAEPVFVGVQMPKIGDGLGIYAGASAQVTGNTISGNQRFGVVTDGAKGAATTIDGNTFSDDAAGTIILQDQASAPTIGSNEGATPMSVPAGTYATDKSAFTTAAAPSASGS